MRIVMHVVKVIVYFHFHSLPRLYSETTESVNMFDAQFVVSWKARCQVTFADYALNHPFLKSVVHKLSIDM